MSLKVLTNGLVNRNTMRILIYILVATAILAAVIFVGIQFWSTSDGNDAPTPNLPFGTGDDPVTLPPDREEVAGHKVELQEGGLVDVTELVEHPSTELRAEDFYRLSYRPEMYSIYYNQNSRNIFIDLYSQPVVEARRLAESHLLEVLPFTDDEICELNISVQTNGLVDQRYAGRELGLSFCPSGVSL